MLQHSQFHHVSMTRAAISPDYGLQQSLDLLYPIIGGSVSAVSQCVGHPANPGSAHSYLKVLKDLQRKPPVHCYSAYSKFMT